MIDVMTMRVNECTFVQRSSFLYDRASQMGCHLRGAYPCVPFFTRMLVTAHLVLVLA